MERTRPDLAAPRTDLDDFFAELTHASRRLLLLDYDGTLAPFRINPAEAVPYEGVRDLLDGIMRDPATTVVIVTGRPARSVLPLLRLRRSPSVWGSHGWDYLNADGEYRCGPLDAQPLRRLLRDQTWIEDVEKKGGRLEYKSGGVAIHWRGLPPESIADVRQVVLTHWNNSDVHAHLQWHDFDGGVELRVPGRNKGDAINDMLQEHAGAVAAYLGDDLTDEDAFKAIRGRGLGILVREIYRPTFAQAWLRPPEQLLGFLARWQSIGRKDRI